MLNVIDRFLSRFRKKKLKCDYCHSYLPGIILGKDEEFGFTSYICGDLFHDDLLLDLEKMYEDPINSNK